MRKSGTKLSPSDRLQEQLRTLKRQNELLKSQLMDTSLINEMTKVMHSSTDPERIIQTVLLGIQEITEFDRIVLFGINADEFRLEPKAWVGFDEASIRSLSIPLGFDGGEITDAIFLNRHFIVENPDSDFDVFARKLRSQSYLVIPFVSKVTRKCWEVGDCTNTTCSVHGSFNPYCWSEPGAGDSTKKTSEDERRKNCVRCPNFKAEGVFWMDRAEKKAAITGENITTLTTILNQAGIILENFRIFSALEEANAGLQNANSRLKIVNNDLRVAQSRIRKDLEHARSIQQGLLPQDIGLSDVLSAAATYIPAEAVGGDYYDVFEISPSKYGIVVADVSGHGVSSSLIMSMVKVLLKTFASKESGPQETLETINETFLTEIQTDNFVTIFYAVLDTENHTMCYNSAGHCPMIFINKETGKCEMIKADGLFLGVFPDMMLEQACINYEPGKLRLVLYTDGLTEAKNSRDEMFELFRLEKVALDTANKTPDECLNEILSTQREFCGTKEEPEDDITLLVIDL